MEINIRVFGEDGELILDTTIKKTHERPADEKEESATSNLVRTFQRVDSPAPKRRGRKPKNRTAEPTVQFG